jgi:energy-coupling factor transport system permease protein
MRDGVSSPLLVHPITWVVWLGAVLVAASTTRNPLYLTLMLICVIIVVTVMRSYVPDQTTPLPISPVQFALFVTISTTLFNGLTTHMGKTVLFSLPAFLPLLGGNITLEALLYGFTNGLIISCLFAAFTVLHLVLPIRSIIRFIPRAFAPLAVVISIAVTFVPTTLRQFRQIREAQAVRGHRVRGLRDWLPLLLPLLVGGLERALMLAEAMTARGFASSTSQEHRVSLRVVVVVGLTALLAGWLMRLVWGYALVGGGGMLVGGGLILGGVWAAGRNHPATVYRRERWQWWDGVVLTGAIVVLAVFLTLVPGIDRKVLYYMPYPLATLPLFHVGVGAAVMGVLGPVLVGMWRESREQAVGDDARTLA